LRRDNEKLLIGLLFSEDNDEAVMSEILDFYNKCRTYNKPDMERQK